MATFDVGDNCTTPINTLVRSLSGRNLPLAAAGVLPMGLAHGRTLLRPVPAGTVITREDVRMDPEDDTVRVRMAMEEAFADGQTGASSAAP